MQKIKGKCNINILRHYNTEAFTFILQQSLDILLWEFMVATELTSSSHSIFLFSTFSRSLISYQLACSPLQATVEGNERGAGNYVEMKSSMPFWMKIGLMMDAHTS